MTEPAFGDNYRLVFVRIEPCTPPAKCTVTYNMMATMTHQHHILPAVITFIPVDIYGISSEIFSLTHARSSENT